VNSIVKLLSKDFLKLVIIGIVIAIPITYFIMNSWLQSFAYRITIGWWIFLLSSLIVTFIAAFTISYQTIKTAISNPAKALKYE
jgi:putative ABC transport system permease protein